LTIQGNFEIRFPIKKNFFIGDLAGTIFTDMAFIDSCTGFFDCSDFSSPNGARKLNNQLGWSVGLGLRYLLPIGPISLDWAISPIRSANTSFGRMNRIHLSFGYMF
jgi:outer membrane protein assembly factor BamA